MNDIPASAIKFTQVLGDHSFAQAVLRFHNLTVIRRESDETELLVRVSGGEEVRFVLQPSARNDLVAALTAPPA